MEREASEEEVRKAYRDLLADSRGKIAAFVGEGKGIDEIIAAKPLAKYDEKWGNGFMTPPNFIRCVHASLSRTVEKKQ